MIAVIAIIAGLALRVVEFMRDRPLWLDEAMLALNIAARPLSQLARPLDYDQSAPLAYLWFERLAVVVGGVSERSLRVVPFIAGLAVVPLVWRAARRLAGARAAAIATVTLARYVRRRGKAIRGRSARDVAHRLACLTSRRCAG
jgi:hypothetical protein